MKRWRTVSGCLIGVLALSACAGSSPPPAEPAPVLVWPSPPSEARIAFVRSFGRAEDLGITPGFFRRLGDALFGHEDVRLIRPMAVTTGTDGVLYVADPGARTVFRFDPAHNRSDTILREHKQALPSPVGLARGPDGVIYVADSALRDVLVIKRGERIARPLGLKQPVTQPSGLACDVATGTLYVVDTGAHQIKVYDRNGELRTSFGQRGNGDGEFNYPTLIWRDASGRLYVTDSLNFRVQMFDGDGRFLGKFGDHGDATGHHALPKGVATDRYGHVYVVDTQFHALQIFDPSGAFLLNLGSQGRGDGEFWLPTGIYIDNGVTIYIADSHNQRVQVFRYVGGQS
jgi:DNA-binding beta-propeller fold protein YncE